MAYRKKIKVNIFSKQSIDDAIKELNAQKQELEKRNTEFLTKLGDKMARFLEEAYNAFLITPTVNGNMVTVTVEGNGLLFVEFGTGQPADESQGVRWGYVAGSWSAEHAQTYQRFLDGDPAFMDADGKYIYNSEPKDAFMHLETQLPTMIRQTAREVFKA